MLLVRRGHDWTCSVCVGLLTQIQFHTENWLLKCLKSIVSFIYSFKASLISDSSLSSFPYLKHDVTLQPRKVLCPRSMAHTQDTFCSLRVPWAHCLLRALKITQPSSHLWHLLLQHTLKTQTAFHNFLPWKNSYYVLCIGSVLAHSQQKIFYRLKFYSLPFEEKGSLLNYFLPPHWNLLCLHVKIIKCSQKHRIDFNVFI